MEKIRIDHNPISLYTERIAHWEFYESEHVGKVMMCSNCKCCYSPYIAYKNYCANCGYEMLPKEEDDDYE